jgi:hypothetical protein
LTAENDAAETAIDNVMHRTEGIRMPAAHTLFLSLPPSAGLRDAAIIFVLANVHANQEFAVFDWLLAFDLV